MIVSIPCNQCQDNDFTHNFHLISLSRTNTTSKSILLYPTLLIWRHGTYWWLSAKTAATPLLTPCGYCSLALSHRCIDGLVQERRNSIANALELRHSCTKPWICNHHDDIGKVSECQEYPSAMKPAPLPPREPVKAERPYRINVRENLKRCIDWGTYLPICIYIYTLQQWHSEWLLVIPPDSKVHGANMGPIWGRQDPGGPHVGPMNFAISASTCHVELFSA